MTFALPFLLFSGISGQLSEVKSKTQVLRWTKLAEVFIMLLAALGFWLQDFGILACVLFLMGAQSAFFSPSKDGVIPEMVEDRLLIPANGLVQMLTFLAVILGIFLAGHLSQWFVNQPVFNGAFCVLVALAGVATVYQIPPTNANRPRLKMNRHPFRRLFQTFALIKRDAGLVVALFAGSFFWFSGGMVTQLVNHYGMKLLELGEAGTSKMLASIALGIMIGCLSASPAQKKLGGRMTVLVGGLGVFLSEGSLFYYQMPLPALLLLMLSAGFFTGLYYIPIAAFLQERPPWGTKGEVLAAVNFCKQLGILVSGATWLVFMALEVPAHYVWWVLCGSLGIMLTWMAPQLRQLDS